MSPTFSQVATGVLTGAAVSSQVAYPLLRGKGLHRLTIGSVAVFCGASIGDAGRRGGARGAVTTLATAGGLGLLAEVVGTKSGRIFGKYRYAGTLGPQVLDVPVVVPLAWTMMAGPALQLGRHLARDQPTGRRDVVAVATAAWTLASWDLFLDPQMTAAGHWSFGEPHPHLPGAPGIPISNYLGWLGTAALICTVLHRVVPEHPDTQQTVPAILLGWTWVGSTLANAAFFRRPLVAVYGGVAMGTTVLPYLRSVLRRRAS